ncbi:MAG: UDP-glucose 4-epimerase GalE [Deferribacterota bacterium]|nr:UDP-glucose 4-epimerase GalE [Deferribacterota bacterium]
MCGRILITGGAGYIGSHVNKLLLEMGYKTIVLDNLSFGHREFVKNTDFILGDTSDKYLLDLIFKNYKIESVMHFAAFAYVGESVQNPSKYYINNVVNTINLLEKLITYKINNLIFSSTCAIYGNPQYTPIDEKHPKNPINPYGKSKLMVENILADYRTSYNLNYTSLRYFNVAGADLSSEIGEWHEPETHIIPILLDVALGKRKEFVVYGDDYDTEDGSCIRDYIHVLDLADCHIKALEWTRKKNSGAFNIGSEKGYSVKEIIEIAQKVINKKIPFKIGDRREGDPDILVATNKKAKNILGYRPQYSDIETIIRTAWKWHVKLNKQIKGKQD